MTRRSKLWLAVATLFTLINLGGAGIAGAGGEGLHTAVHVVLAVVGAYFMWRLASRSRPQQLPVVRQAAERLEHLQQSVDAIALEVERIGEAQRFLAQLAAERVEASRLEPHP